MSTESILSVLETAEWSEPIHDSATVTLEWIGVDHRGIEIEILAVIDRQDPDTLWIIHAMPTSYRRSAT